MRQLACTAPGVVEWIDTPEPTIQDPTDALIRPVAVARCEIDPMLVFLGPPSPEGFALGHEAVAEVVALGDAVTDLEPGQLVLPSFQVSCGLCPTCRAGHTANCDEYPVLSDYGMQPLSGVEYGGMLSDLVRVPHAAAMLTPLPAGVDPVSAASVPDNVIDGYRAVAPHLADSPQTDVLVVIHGNRSIGLYAAMAAGALGAGSVTVASDDDEVLRLAEVVGAAPLRTDFGRRAGRWPLVVDCGVKVAGLHYAIASTTPEGTLHSVSYLAEEPMVPMPLGKLYTLGINFHIGRAHSAALLPEVIALVAAGDLAPELVTTQTIDWDDAPAHYTDETVKLVVRRYMKPTPGTKRTST